MMRDPGSDSGPIAVGERVAVKSDGREGQVIRVVDDGRVVVQADPVVIAGARFVASLENLKLQRGTDPAVRSAADELLDRLARLLNEYPASDYEAVCRELRELLAEAGREIFGSGPLQANRNPDISDVEHYEANAQAAYLVGRYIRDSNGAVWKVSEWDAVGKDGWATISDGAAHWDRPEQVEPI